MRVIMVMVLSMFCLASMAQTRMVTGKVTSSEGGTAVSQATVRLKGAVAVSQTREDGTFSIEVVANSSDILVFSHPDFDEVEIFLDGKKEVNVTLTSNVRYNQYGVKVNRRPLFTEERNGILVFESKDEKYKAWFDVRVQADGQVFFGDTYNEIGNGLSMRRARFAVKTEFLNHWYAEFDMDIANSELELKDAYLQYTFTKGPYMRFGNFKEYYSMESTTTSRYLTFIERPMSVNIFAPSRHIGFGMSYRYKWLLGFGGVFFQAVDDLEERTFSKDNNKDYGMDEGYSLTGKLVFMPFYDKNDKGIHVGVAGSYRTPKTDAEVPGTIRYSTRSLSNINRKKYIDTDLIGNLDHATLGGFELAGYYKNFRVQGEYLWSGVHRKEGLETLKYDGWYAFASVLVFGGKYNYDTGDGEFTQVGRGKKWGDIELAVRYDYLNMNNFDQIVIGGAGEGYTFGINYYANNNVKIMLNYSYLNHDRYANGKNTLYIGYDMNGELTKDPRQVADGAGKAGEDYHQIGIRFEVDF